MKIYTRGGDTGETALFGGDRVAKDNIRIQAVGDVDELNAVLGWAVSGITNATVQARLETIQHDLFALGAELATPPPRAGRTRPETPGLSADSTGQLEEWIDEAQEELPTLSAFVLPGGVASAAALHLARTVCRRAERSVVRLARTTEVDPAVLAFLNRLSDLLFVLARGENHDAGRPDVEWRKGS